jgi:adenylate kinase family enzyme
MQGFVLEGYPKNRQQWDNIKNLRIHPNFIIGLDVPEEVVLERLQKDKDETFSKRYEKWKSFKSSLAG